MKTIQELTSELYTLLKARDFNVTDKSFPELEYEVKKAIAEINNQRRFEATETKLYDKKYEHLIIPLCLSSFAKIGAEGETSHSENGIVRNYTTGGDYPSDVLNSIIPLIK